MGSAAQGSVPARPGCSGGRQVQRQPHRAVRMRGVQRLRQTLAGLVGRLALLHGMRMRGGKWAAPRGGWDRTVLRTAAGRPRLVRAWVPAQNVAHANLYALPMPGWVCK